MGMWSQADPRPRYRRSQLMRQGLITGGPRSTAPVRAPCQSSGQPGDRRLALDRAPLRGKAQRPCPPWSRGSVWPRTASGTASVAAAIGQTHTGAVLPMPRARATRRHPLPPAACRLAGSAPALPRGGRRRLAHARCLRCVSLCPCRVPAEVLCRADRM